MNVSDHETRLFFIIKFSNKNLATILTGFLWLFHPTQTPFARNVISIGIETFLCNQNVCRAKKEEATETAAEKKR